jgi:hypothetical protein
MMGTIKAVVNGYYIVGRVEGFRVPDAARPYWKIWMEDGRTFRATGEITIEGVDGKEDADGKAEGNQDNA